MGTKSKNDLLFEIVIAEDDEGLNNLITKNLKRHGYECVQAFNGQQAINAVKKGHNQILILDYRLPDLNGEEVILTLRKKNGLVPPFIVMTGYGDEKIAVKMMKLGAKDYITKETKFIEIITEKLERNILELEKEEENKRFKKLLQDTEQLAGVGGWQWFVKQDKWVMSDNWMQLHGCTKKHFTSDSLIQIAHPDDAEKINKAFTKTATTGEPYQIEHRIIRQDNGEIRYIKASGKAERDENGNVLLVIGAAMDITNQKESEKLLATSSEMLEETGRIAKIGGWELNLENEKLIWSDITKKIHEVPEDFNPNLENALQFYPKEYRKQLEKLVQRAIKKGESYEIEVPLKTAKGNIVWTHSIGNPVFNNGKCIKLRGTFQDITQRKTAESQLRDSEERLKVLFESAPDAIYLHDLKGNFVDGNQAAEKMLGYKRVELIGKSFTKLNLLPLKYLKKAGANLLKNAQGKTTGPDEFELIHRDGHKISVEIRAFPVKILEKARIMGVVRDISKRKKAETELHRSEEKFRSIFENSALGIFRSTPEGKYEEVNEAFARILGFNSPKEMMEKVTDISALYKNPGDREKIKKEFAEKGFVENYEIMAHHPTKETVWISVNAKQQHSGGQIYYEGTIQDITKKKVAEEKLLETKQRLQILADNIPDEIFIKDEQHRFVYVNPKKAQADGTTPEAMTGKTDFDFFSETAARKSLKDDERVLKTGEPIINKEERLTGKGGDSRWVLVTKLPRLDQAGSIIGTMGISREITNLKKAEQILKKNEKQLELRKNIAEAFVLEEKDKIFYNVLHALLGNYNSKFGYFGYINQNGDLVCPSMTHDIWNECEVKNKSIVFPKENWTGLWGESLKKQKSLIKNANLKVPNGHVPLNNAMVGIIEYQGKLIGQLAFANGNKSYTDSDLEELDEICKYISPLLHAELSEEQHKKELVEAKEKAEESDRLKSAFLANMSHEIRTPMNGIMGFTNLLQDAEISGEERDNFIQIIQQSGKRMLDTVNDLIDISRIETGQVEIQHEEFKIKEELRNLHRFFEADAKNKNLTLTMNTCCEDEIVVNSDRNKFNSIASNLIKNAIKYTHQGSIEIGCSCNNDSIKIFVTDTGIGIPEKLRKDIFSRFVQVEQGYTRNYEGAGLGLSIAKAYTEMLGGDIGVESEEGKGSTFYFSIPVTKRIAKNTKSKGTGSSPEKDLTNLKNLRVLVAEDDEVSQYHLEILLEDKVAKIYFAKTGREAIETYQKNPDINLILMDIKMPEMDGHEATRKIRSFDKKVPVIAQTAYALQGDQEKALDAGCNDYITKPVDSDELFAKIANFLHN